MSLLSRLLRVALPFAICLAFAPGVFASGGFRRGDANSDAQVDVSDAVAVLQVLFLGGAEPKCADSADANDDGSIDISDALFTLIRLFLGGPDFPAPGSSCGSDPTDDALSCDAYEPCEVVYGTNEFSTPLAGGPGGRGLAEDFDGAVPPGAVDPAGNPPSPSAPPERLIEESDIYKLSGSLLYVMNRYRGLQILDLSDLDRPRLVGHAPIYGYPREMYVRDNTAYVIVSDYYSFWRDELSSDAIVRGFYGSQLRIIDVKDPTAPIVAGGIDLQGDLTDSRLVGNVLYLVAQRYAWYSRYGSTDTEDKTVVLSVQVGDPAQVKVIDSKEFPRQGWEHHISVTPQTIYLAASGWTWDGRTGRYDTRIRYIDIRDPDGLIQVRGETRAPGRVQDRWSMDEHNGVLRVASGQSWGNGDVYLTTYSVANPDQIQRLGQTVLHVNESLTAARFDGPRGYLVSYRNIDPLFTFDLSDPTRPRLLGELEMTGWLDFIVPMGDRLVALGHEDTTNSSGGREIRLAVSLIDVGKPSVPALLSRVVLDGLWGWVPSDRDDFAKVFRTLPDQGLILFPYQAWDPADYKHVGGVQLIDFDRSTLIRRGLIRDAGWVERGIPHDPSTVLTLASDVFQAIDIQDRDHPHVRSRLELARNVQQLAVLPGDFTLQLTGDWWRGDMSLLVTTKGDPNALEPVSELHLPAPYGRLFVNGSFAYVSSIEEASNPADLSVRRVTRIRVVDLSDPAEPRVRGTVDLPEEVWATYGVWYWGWGDEAVQVGGSTLVFHRYPYSFWWDCFDCGIAQGAAPAPEHTLYFVDLSDPDAPKLASTQTIASTDWAWGLKVSGTRLYLSFYRAFLEDSVWMAKYFVARFEAADPADPVRLPDVNIPGMLIDATADGKYLYTLETYWDQGFTNLRVILHVLALQDDKAYLQSSVELEGYSAGILVDGEAVVALTQEWVSTTVEGAGTQWVSRSTLFAIDVADPQNAAIAGKANVPIDYGYLQKLEGGRAFVGAGPGILTYRVEDLENPKFERFFRTQGWSQEIVLDGDRAYVPSGWYGVQALELDG